MLFYTKDQMTSNSLERKMQQGLQKTALLQKIPLKNREKS